ncbi:hypothetical protein QYM36_018394 [Artemia franciscana]|uniref:Mitochondrial inner membrane protease ATP23 n=2 Tax=Artemia franciscana TaxID=6661 RepID=A0AA88L0F7_ARTSF|nr:hypothetical protein QYM36_018394 [Artemia franciscana]KAK2703050.1 hypothetical protein QYM36_018394 [Artemia franciscana]
MTVTGQSDDEWGYDLYPGRKGETYKPSLFQKLWLGEGRDMFDHIRCESNVVSCMKDSPLVRTMMAALKSSGCPIDVRRHISCESCEKIVTGGYDQQHNQIVICQNSARSKDAVLGSLVHEMIHMFDYCRQELDFADTKHLACTEIRAANLTHCSFINAFLGGAAAPWRIAKTHQECVKNRAAESVVAVRKIPFEEARKIVDSVFEPCYADLEPLGRRMRRNSADPIRIEREKHIFGYTSE